MRFAIFGDIHANLEALEAMLKTAEGLQIDEYLCLGDIVGYGANPEECVQRIREIGAMCLAGNHDHATIGRLDISYFNEYARNAALWTRDHVSDETKAFLQSLPFIAYLKDFVVVHGSLHAPELFNYVQTIRDAETNFHLLERPLCFFGHSHQPVAFFNTEPMTYTLELQFVADPSVKTLINVGSVGQPRDEDPRAAFCVFDSDTYEVVIHRIEYDIDTAAGKIMDAGLPEALALRLTLGK